MSETERICPNCHADVSAETDVQLGGGGPQSGDFSICGYCSAILRFTDALDLRRASETEILEAITEWPDMEETFELGLKVVRHWNEMMGAR